MKGARPKLLTMGWIGISVIFCNLIYLSELQAQSYARKENAIWLNDGHGINFNQASPVAQISQYFNWNFNFNRASSAVSDADGELLFYSDGFFVWDRNDNLMPNGWNIFQSALPGNRYFISPTWGLPLTLDGVVIIPVPGSTHKYYLFVAPFVYNNDSPTWESSEYYGRLFYTIIDMELNNGLGDIDVSQGINILDTAMAGNLHAVAGEDCNIWLIGLGYDANMKAFNINSAGIDPEPVVSVMASPLSPYVQELTASPDRQRVAYSASEEVVLMDFDPQTGLFSNQIFIGGQVSDYMSFSPNSTVLYVGGLIGIRQYDLTDLTNPLTLLTINDLSAFELDLPMRLGPDGKIYLSYQTIEFNPAAGGTQPVAYGATIAQPDVLGAGCQFQLLEEQTLPLLRRSSTISSKRVVELGQEVPVLIYDTVSAPTAKVTLCFGAPEVLAPQLNASDAGTDYHWMVNTVGSTFVRMGDDNTSSWIATEPGIYAVQYFTSAPCTFHQDTFIVESVQFSLYLGADRLSCDGSPVGLTANVDDAVYLWNDNSNGQELLAETSGQYWVAVTKDGCSIHDTVMVTILDMEQNLGVDTTVCAEDPFGLLLEAHVPEGSDVLWNTGSRASSIVASTAGLYTVEVRYDVCFGSDSILIEEAYCNCPYLLPTAFSPNGDGKNDDYRPVLPSDCPVQGYKLEIYNRWGARIYTSYDPAQGWDGRINGMPADVGTYIYRIQMTIGLDAKKVAGQGDFTLLR